MIVTISLIYTLFCLTAEGPTPETGQHQGRRQPGMVVEQLLGGVPRQESKHTGPGDGRCLVVHHPAMGIQEGCP